MGVAATKWSGGSMPDQKVGPPVTRKLVFKNFGPDPPPPLRGFKISKYLQTSFVDGPYEFFEVYTTTLQYYCRGGQTFLFRSKICFGKNTNYTFFLYLEKNK